MYSERMSILKSSAIREILKLTAKPGMISLAGGLPAPELFPVREISQAARDVLHRYGPAALQYSITEGIIPLREKIVKKMDPDGHGIDIENILITQGSQQGLDLISKVFIDKGDPVFTETPSYLGAIQSFRLFQAEVVQIPSNEEGIDMDELEKRLNRQNSGLIYLMPNFQNPSGATLSMERRERLIELVVKKDIMVIEDDPYGELRFEGKSLPPLYSLAGSRNVIYLSTFSKTIAPGFRVAFVIAEKEVIKKLATVKQATDLQTNTLGQFIVNEYLENGNYHKHINLIRRVYKERRDCMLAAMERYFPDEISWNRPAGGMFIWVMLPGGWDANEILLECIENNVAFVPGQEFSPDGSVKNTMRLNFSNASPEDIEKGIKRIGDVLKKRLEIMMVTNNG